MNNSKHVHFKSLDDDKPIVIKDHKKVNNISSKNDPNVIKGGDEVDGDNSGDWDYGDSDVDYDFNDNHDIGGDVDCDYNDDCDDVGYDFGDDGGP